MFSSVPSLATTQDFDSHGHSAVSAAAADKRRNAPGAAVVAVFLMPNGENRGVAMLLSTPATIDNPESSGHDATRTVHGCAATVARAAVLDLRLQTRASDSLFLYTPAGIPLREGVDAFTPAIQPLVGAEGPSECVEARGRRCEVLQGPVVKLHVLLLGQTWVWPGVSVRMSY